MKNIIYTISLLLIITLISCEKVIDLEINEAEQKYVVEAFTSNIEGRNYVKISKTGNVYTQNNFEKVSNAVVTITDKNSVVTTFQEDPNTKGTFLAPGFKIEELSTYNLKITTEDETMTSIVTSRTVAPINWLFPIQGSQAFGADTNKLNLLFSMTDPIGKGDNYRFILTIDGVQDDYYYINPDVLVSEPVIEGLFFGTSIDSGAIVHVELLNMDDANYDYFYGLVNNTETGPFSATPANPVTNITGNVLGYFGAYMIDTATVVMPS